YNLTSHICFVVISTNSAKTKLLLLVTQYLASSGVMIILSLVLVSLASTKLHEFFFIKLSPAKYCSCSVAPQVVLNAIRNISLRVLRILDIILSATVNSIVTDPLSVFKR